MFSGEWPLDDKSFHHEANFYGLSKEMLGDLLYMAYVVADVAIVFFQKMLLFVFTFKIFY